jgi:hypothetical protein
MISFNRLGPDATAAAPFFDDIFDGQLPDQLVTLQQFKGKKDF